MGDTAVYWLHPLGHNFWVDRILLDLKIQRGQEAPS